MPQTRRHRVERRPIRRERDRALALLAVLGAFLVGYALVATNDRLVATLDDKVVAALTSFVSIGVSVLVTTFSFVFVALSLVSAQFSPRVVRHFWHADRFRFIFLWSSIAVFAFCFVIQFADIPRLHLLGLFLGSYQIFVLFPVFLGYLADNINAASITKNISDRTVAEIARDYSVHPGSYDDSRERGIIAARESGFLENVDTDKLTSLFNSLRDTNTEVTLKISNYIGSFVEVGSKLAVVEPAIAIDQSTEKAIASCFSLHKFRSYDKDIEYGIRQLVDIGIKAISPAINDPTTCVNCIHQLGVILKEIGIREDDSELSKRLQTNGIFLKEPNFEQYLDDAFDQIYQWGRRDHVIVRTIIGALSEVVSALPTPERVETVIKEMDEMELGSLTQGGSSDAFALAEHRNYARKSLMHFYLAAAERIEFLGSPDRAEGLRLNAKKCELSIEGAV
ncbi:MAG: DUF2254 domain-containing protein [Pyrinomonadaceae bacterium]|nr:DUF2254 domain-containing protein [Pyrinomonadaceae bacterium]MBP9109005.1 DUF2254 domain-containing protein [Pyrinomonadaceae bacterium]